MATKVTTSTFTVDERGVMIAALSNYETLLKSVQETETDAELKSEMTVDLELVRTLREKLEGGAA